MEIVVVILLIVIVFLGGALALYVRELHRIARFLQTRSPESNAKLATNVPLPGFKKLIRAIDEGLVAQRAREHARRLSEQEFQAGLVGLSHDIRTPLAGAKGYMQLAVDEGDASARMEHLEAASDRLDAMKDLLDQLFAYTRSEARMHTDTPETVDAVTILAEVLLGNLPVFEQAGIELEVDLGERVFDVAASEEDLRRIFDNAIDNMLKHGIDPFIVQRIGSTIMFSNGVANPEVLDTGQIFDRFYRADPARSETGAGLGLAVVKNLCDAYDIAVDAHLEPDSIFVLELRFPSSGAM